MAEETPTPDEETTEEAVSGESVAEEATVAEEALSEDAAAEAPAEEAPAGSKPKRRRRKAQAARPRPSLTPQERQAQRDAERRRKATVRRDRRLRERERARARRDGSGAAEELPSLRAPATGQQKTRQGIVVSDRAAKTITVRIDVTRRHPQYQKVVRTSATLHAHDEQGDAHIGDTVIVKECRPVSRTKRWRLIEVLERAR
jgi:small subunit ribosomal protein S17